MNTLSDNGNPLVSVVIPLYNKAKYIERALSSIATQRFKPFEIIVVDDGSTDDGPEKVVSFRDADVTLIRQENKGPGAARNAGLAIATGKYIAFLDADDEWLPSFLEAGISVLEDTESNATAVSTGRIISPEMKRLTFEGLDTVFEITAKTHISFAIKIFMVTQAPNFMIMKTEIARKLGGYFDRYKCLRGEDRYFYLKILFNERIGIISSPLGIYHSEASELCGCPSEYYSEEVSPDLLYPDEILQSCHKSKHRLLQDFLSELLFSEMRLLTIKGNYTDTKKLFESFSRKCYINPKQKIKLKFLLIIAPVVPALHKGWQFIRIALK